MRHEIEPGIPLLDREPNGFFPRANFTLTRVSAREGQKIEMLFAHLKRKLQLRRLRLRGISGASDEFSACRHDAKLEETSPVYGRSPANTDRLPSLKTWYMQRYRSERDWTDETSISTIARHLNLSLLPTATFRSA
jgi:hypothetical protein